MVDLHGLGEGVEHGQGFRQEGSLEVHLPWQRGHAHSVKAAPWLAAGFASVPSSDRVAPCGGGAEAGTVNDGLSFLPAFVEELDQTGAFE
jgi:hypothetical protein